MNARLMTLIAAASAALLGTGGPASAAATSHGILIAARETNASLEARFVLSLLSEARVQIALAGLAGQRRTLGPVSAIAAESATIWDDLRGQLEDTARELRLNVPVAPVAGEQLLLARFGRLGDAAFDAAFLQSVDRADRTALATMESLDARVDPRILFIADRAVPRFLTLRTIVEPQLGR